MPRKTTIKIDLGDSFIEAGRFQDVNAGMKLSDFVNTYPAKFPPGVYEKNKDRAIGELIFDPCSVIGDRTAAAAQSAGSAFRSQLNELRDRQSQEATAIESDEKNPEFNPIDLKDRSAVLTAYHHELKALARFLRNDISVLVTCDKILTEFIYEHVCAEAGKKVVLDTQQPEGEEKRSKAAEFKGALQGGDKAAEKPNLREIINNLKPDQILVVRSLDMFNTPELIDLIYLGTGQDKKPLILAFLDPSLEVKKVLTDRFSVHIQLMGLPRHVSLDDKVQHYTVTHLLTRKERACFDKYDPEGLYKNVSGLNPIQFRNAMRYVAAEKAANSPAVDIYRCIRQFKRSTSDEIEIPDTHFNDIGGYDHIKLQLRRIIALIAGPIEGIGEKQRGQLIPRGFVFHGPPGTGKTLFAKAIANELNATIQMISGPEIMDKYVGQSEDNLRRIFSVARRNAPAVIFFDEFDSIAGQRSNYSDGGARANNAVVAQLLTELDGFRQDQTVLVIGTTNRIDIIDEALLRPSRLRPIEIGNPDFTARRSVARIHAESFGIDKQLKSLYQLTAGYAGRESDESGNIPEAFLKKLFESHAPYKKRWEIEEQRAAFGRDIREFFSFVKKQEPLAEKARPGSDEPFQKMLDKIVELGVKYGVNLLKSDSSDDKGEEQDGLIPTMRQDIGDLFSLLQSERRQNSENARDDFYAAVLDLIAEYAANFNNDEIRAVFQEASLEFLLEGQLITPRYLGQKIGIIRKRRDEREAVHLSSARGSVR